MNCITKTFQKSVRVVLFGVILAGLGGNAFAHKVSSVSAIVNIDTKTQTYEVNAAMDVERSEDEALNDAISPEEAARTFAEDYLIIQFDKVDQDPKLKIDMLVASDENTPEELQRQQIMTTLSGPIPEDAKEFLMYLDPNCPMAVVMVIIKDKKPARRMQVVLAGEFSRPVNVEPVVDGDPFKQAGSEKGEKSKGDAPDSILPASDGPEAGAFRAGWTTFFEKGLINIGIVLAILLMSLSLKPVSSRLTALVISQSLGVSLAAFGFIPSPDWLILVIGGGLTVLALSAMISKNLNAVRIALILIVGGFQGVFLTQLLPFRRLFGEGEMMQVGHLIGFHLGVEVAQLLVAVVAAALLLILSRYEGYRKIVVPALVAVLAGYGLFLVGSEIF